MLSNNQSRLVYCLWCLTPLSTIFQLYVSVSFIDGGNQSADKLYQIMLYQVNQSEVEIQINNQRTNCVSDHLMTLFILDHYKRYQSECM